MTTPVFLPKDDNSIPDAYGIVIDYINGKSSEFEIAQHKIIDVVKIPDPNGPFEMDGGKYRLDPAPLPFLEIITKDDYIKTIPMSSVQCIGFDKRFSQLLDIKDKKSKKNNGIRIAD